MLIFRSATVPARQHVQGFTLIELMVMLALLVALAMLAMYPMQEWINNNRVRSTADVLQNGLRQAQAEATRRSRTVMFALTDTATFAESADPDDLEVATEAGGSNRVRAPHWGIFATRRTGADAEFIEAGLQDNSGRAARITGPAAICFNSLGRLVTRTNAAAGVGDASCESTGIPARYDVDMDGANARSLRVEVGVGGRILMCDPNAAADRLDACPP